MGRAWAGRLGVSTVEVSTDAGKSWSEAKLQEPVGSFAWRGWSYDWVAEPGEYLLCVRARDSEGNVQPVEQSWSFQGMGNNTVQRVSVIVD